MSTSGYPTHDFVRELINDTDANKQIFSFADIDDALKDNRVEFRYESLSAVETIASGGVTTYLIFTSKEKHWSIDTAVYDSNYDALTPISSDLRNGRWTFSTEPSRPVRVLGFSYDPYAAAADLLEQRSSQLSEEIQSFSGANGSFSYANKRRGPMDMAKFYRTKSRVTVGSGTLSREDLC